MSGVAQTLAVLERYIVHGHRAVPEQTAALMCCPSVSLAVRT